MSLLLSSFKISAAAHNHTRLLLYRSLLLLLYEQAIDFALNCIECIIVTLTPPAGRKSVRPTHSPHLCSTNFMFMI